MNTSFSVRAYDSDQSHIHIYLTLTYKYTSSSDNQTNLDTDSKDGVLNIAPQSARLSFFLFCFLRYYLVLRTGFLGYCGRLVSKKLCLSVQVTFPMTARIVIVVFPSRSLGIDVWKRGGQGVGNAACTLSPLVSQNIILLSNCQSFLTRRLQTSGCHPCLIMPLYIAVLSRRSTVVPRTCDMIYGQTPLGYTLMIRPQLSKKAIDDFLEL